MSTGQNEKRPAISNILLICPKAPAKKIGGIAAIRRDITFPAFSLTLPLTFEGVSFNYMCLRI